MKKTITIFITGIILQLFLTSQGAGYGNQIARLEEKIKATGEENLKLELNIAKSVSCSNIAQKAVDNGFMPVAASGKHSSSVALRR